MRSINLFIFLIVFTSLLFSCREDNDKNIQMEYIRKHGNDVPDDLSGRIFDSPLGEMAETMLNIYSILKEHGL